MTPEEAIEALRLIHRPVWYQSSFLDRDHVGCAACGGHGLCLTNKILDRIKPTDAHTTGYPGDQGPFVA